MIKNTYVGAVRTLTNKYQKFMTCQLVDNIYLFYNKSFKANYMLFIFIATI